MREQGLSRRRFIAGGLGLGASVLAGGTLSRAWTLLAREDLVPGALVDLELEPGRWVVTDDHLSFAAIGDNGSGGRQAVELAAQLALSYRREPFGLLSMLGDICYYGPISQRFEAVFLRPMRPLIDAGIDFELAVGNHDGDIFFEEGVPDVEETLARLGTPGRFYTLRRGPAEFFYLDSGTIGFEGRLGLEQLTWLEQALAAADAPWRIVCLHHPIYSSGVHGSSPRLRRLLEPLLVRHGVDLVLAGHDHHYERTVPINGITHVISGGGCKLTPVWPSRFTAVATSSLQFMRLDVDGNRLVGRSVGVDGQLLDRFELRSRR